MIYDIIILSMILLYVLLCYLIVCIYNMYVHKTADLLINPTSHLSAPTSDTF